MDGALGAQILFISWLTRNHWNVTSWLSLSALMESWLMAVDRVGRHAWSWSYIQGSTLKHENDGKTNNLGWMLYSVYAVLSECCTLCMLYSVHAVLGVCCTRCMLYSVYAVLGVCCTRSMLYSVYASTWCMLVLGVCLYLVYAVLSVNSWSWHGEIERDDLTLCSAMMVELWMRKREMGIMMRMMWRIRVDTKNQSFDILDWVGTSSYRCKYTADRDSYLPYRGR